MQTCKGFLIEEIFVHFIQFSKRPFGSWTKRPFKSSTKDLLNLWLGDLLDPWIRRLFDPWLRDLMDPWLKDLLDPWLRELLNPWLRNLLDIRVARRLNFFFHFHMWKQIFIFMLLQFFHSNRYFPLSLWPHFC